MKYNLRDFQQDLLPAIRKHQQLFKTPNILLLFSYCCDYIFSIHEILLNSKCSNLRQNNWDSSISGKIKAMKLFPSKAKGLKKKNTISLYAAFVFLSKVFGGYCVVFETIAIEC